MREKWGRQFFKREFGDKKQHVKLGQNGIFEGPADRSAWEESSLPDFVRDKLQFPGWRGQIVVLCIRALLSVRKNRMYRSDYSQNWFLDSVLKDHFRQKNYLILRKTHRFNIYKNDFL